MVKMPNFDPRDPCLDLIAGLYNRGVSERDRLIHARDVMNYVHNPRMKIE